MTARSLNWTGGSVGASEWAAGSGGAGRTTQNQEPAGPGREPEVGDSTRLQQKQPLADVKNPGDQSGPFQRVATAQGVLVSVLWALWVPRGMNGALLSGSYLGPHHVQQARL